MEKSTAALGDIASLDLPDMARTPSISGWAVGAADVFDATQARMPSDHFSTAPNAARRLAVTARGRHRHFFGVRV